MNTKHSHDTKSATLIRHIIDFHQEKSQALSLTKLYQLLYLIDFGHYALHGEAVSELEYWRHGRELIPVGAAAYIQLASKMTNEVSEPAVIYATANNTLSDTALEVVEKTLMRLCEVSEEEIDRIMGYHHSWNFARGGKMLDYKWAKSCDFEWLDYFSHEKDREEYELLERERRAIEGNENITQIMKELNKIKV